MGGVLHLQLIIVCCIAVVQCGHGLLLIHLLGDGVETVIQLIELQVHLVHHLLLTLQNLVEFTCDFIKIVFNLLNIGLRVVLFFPKERA